jgi:hypothetical protein
MILLSKLYDTETTLTRLQEDKREFFLSITWHRYCFYREWGYVMILEPNCGGLLERNLLPIILLSQMIPPEPPTLLYATLLAGKLPMSSKILEKRNKKGLGRWGRFFTDSTLEKFHVPFQRVSHRPAGSLLCLILPTKPQHRAKFLPAESNFKKSNKYMDK